MHKTEQSPTPKYKTQRFILKVEVMV